MDIFTDRPNGIVNSTKGPTMAAKEKEKEVLVATHMVLYTDGGCKPSRGIGGYGVHGYTYIEVPAKQGTGCKQAVPTKDGYAMGQGGLPPITVLEYIDAVGSIIPESTNNIAELRAAMKAYDIMVDKDIKNVLLMMDSDYTRKGLQGLADRWSANGWCRQDGGPVANQEFWQALLAKRDLAAAKGIAVELRYVEGHSGDLGNDTADEWASKGIMAGRNDLQLDEIIISPAKGYWNSAVETNRLFSQPNWYFNSKQSSIDPATGHAVYHLGEPREDDELLGKKMVDAAFSVVHLYEPDPILELIRQAHAETDVLLYGNPVLGKLDSIFKKDIISDLTRFGDRFIARDFHNGILRACDGKDPIGVMLTKELRPARKAFAAMDTLGIMEQVLRRHFQADTEGFQVSTDITTHLYETTLVGKNETVKLKPTVTQTDRVIPITASYKKPDGTVGEVALKLTMGYDLPDRNTLAALAGPETKISVVIWPESHQAVNYATVVETKGGYGIWCAPYSNLQLLPPNEGSSS